MSSPVIAPSSQLQKKKSERAGERRRKDGRTDNDDSMYKEYSTAIQARYR
jgi:hypothetical protein